MAQQKKTKQSAEEIEKIAGQQAKYRAQVAQWSTEIAIFLFAVLIAIIILVASGVNTTIVSLIAIVSLAAVWFVARRQGKKLYERFYAEEMRRLRLEVQGIVEKTVEEQLEEQVREALRKRWER